MDELIAHLRLDEQLRPLIDLLGGHPLIGSVLVLLLFLGAAWLVEWLVVRGLKRLTARTSTLVDDQIVRYIRSPLFWSVLLVGVLAAAGLAGVPQGVHDLLRSLAASVMAFLWMLFALRLSKLLLSLACRHGGANALIRPQTLPLFTNLAALAVVALGIYFVFQAWNVDMTAWLASAGIAGIAIGFAAKDTLANLFSGVFIMADSPYKIGDYVVLDGGPQGLRGKVTHIGIRSTRLLTRDDVEVTIPNSIMGNSKVINESGGPYEKYRIRVQVGVAYGSDIDRVKALLQAVAEQEPQVCAEPEPRVRFRRFGPSALELDLLGWVENPELRGRVLDVLNTTIYKRFREEGIEIPFSKHDVYIKELPGSLPPEA